MRKKKKKLVEKYITLRAVSEKTLPPKSWPITTLATMGQRRHYKCLSGGLCGRQGLPYSH